MDEVSGKVISAKKGTKAVPGGPGREDWCNATGSSEMGVRGLRYNSDKLKKAL